MSKTTTHILTLDFDVYTGSWWRELIAYCTGVTSTEHDIGRHHANSYKEDCEDLYEGNDIFESSVPRLDTECGPMPGELAETPGYFNNGYGQHYKEGQEKEALKARNEHEKEKNYPKTKLSKWPAYQSVTIFFNNEPTEEQVKIIKERTLNFLNLNYRGSREATLINIRVGKKEEIVRYKIKKEYGVE